jgi:predicted nucleic acid-binding protein
MRVRKGPERPLYGVDSRLFAYHFAADPRLGPAAARLLQATEEGRCRLVTSVLTLLEVLVFPARHGDEALARRYRSLFDSLPNLTMLPVDQEIADVAARLCAVRGLQTLQAIHLATAIQAGAEAFVSEDQALRQIPEVRVRPLDELV